MNILKNRNLIEIIDFILWINNILALYYKFNNQYIKGLINNFDDEENLSEFISKKIDLINCLL